MALSVFEKKTKMPDDADLSQALGDLFFIWKNIREFVLANAPDISEEWNYSGKSLGWGFRLRNPKKVIVYLIPSEGYFKIGFVFGPAATEEVMRSTVSDEIKTIIDSAVVYAEGRGFRIDVKDESMLEDLFKLIRIKLGIRSPHK